MSKQSEFLKLANMIIEEADRIDKLSKSGKNHIFLSTPELRNVFKKDIKSIDIDKDTIVIRV